MHNYQLRSKHKSDTSQKIFPRRKDKHVTLESSSDVTGHHQDTWRAQVCKESCFICLPAKRGTYFAALSAYYLIGYVLDTYFPPWGNQNRERKKWSYYFAQLYFFPRKTTQRSTAFRSSCTYVHSLQSLCFLKQRGQGDRGAHTAYRFLPNKSNSN